MSNYFQDIIGQLSARSAEATLSILGISDPVLRAFLSEQFNKPVGSDTNFLADPVFEAIFGWEEANTTLDRLGGVLLERVLVEAMDKPPKELKDYAFRKSWKPYQHQYIAWQKLIRTKPQSMVITSGTGSGKTECFMVPVLNDLVRQQQVHQQKLIGVQALFVYPLNALINSQRDRLRAWTSPFKDTVRFSLYNGNMEESVSAMKQSEHPNEILSRKLLRAEPSPLLVTNATMLEYMLVRQVDAPILEKSQGQLKWIVLDEAHTYIGSQSAELSLLLRRVMHGFGVQADDVCFLATSATIGNKDNASLQSYLAGLAGIAKERVVVVGGQRIVPNLQVRSENYDALMSIKNLMAMDNGELISDVRYKALEHHPISRALRDEVTRGGLPKTLNALSNVLFSDEKEVKARHQQTLAWLDVCSGTRTSKTPFLPLRGHLFHQVISGLWACVDKNCVHKQGTLLENEWLFGYVYSQQRELCECGAPVYEVVFCNDCNTPHLKAFEKDNKLIQVSHESVDEFSLNLELDNELDELEDEGVSVVKSEENHTYTLVAKENSQFSFDLPLSLNTQLLDKTDDSIIVHMSNNSDSCGYCGFEATIYMKVFRRCLLGTPFYVSNTVPTLLEFCNDGKKPLDSPARGRRLITFTDSRQGTARLAVKIQQDSERNRLRGLIYEVVAREKGRDNSKERERLENERDEHLVAAEAVKAAKLIKEAQVFLALAQEKEESLKALDVVQSIPWKEMVLKLQDNFDISREMYNYYYGLNPMLFSQDNGGAHKLTNMLLLKEVFSRPKRQNSLETLGLLSIKCEGLQDIDKTPIEWQRWGLSLIDWQDFLKLCVDFVVRTGFINIPKDWINWMGVRISSAQLLSPRVEEAGRKFPKLRKVSGSIHRLIRLLIYVAKLDIKQSRSHDELNQVMYAAWKVLTEEVKVLTPVTGSTPTAYQMNREKMMFSCVEKAWVCPVTHRLLDTTLKGITPYLPKLANDKTAVCQQVNIPVYDFSQAFESKKEQLATVRQWILEQESIKTLRQQNLWTDLSDRILEGGVFFRAAEHSAQQSAERLKNFEADFKKEKLNVLSCSTTMEMGVDIGGISMVAMNNVPPHPANYLQRAGRAGRRQETRALAFTICKDNPHERSIFINPLWPFITHIKSPYITLNSERIVQRHINSLLFSYFLKKVITVQQQQNTKLTTGWFFDNQASDSQADHFCNWLMSCEQQMPEKVSSGLLLIIKDTILNDHNLFSLLSQCYAVIVDIKTVWLEEFVSLSNELESLSTKVIDTDPYKRRIERDLERIKGEYLLSELATRGFLPGYGFPTGIASFDPYSMHDYQFNKAKKQDKNIREDNRSRFRDKPGRGLSVALREYAPGANIVLDGLSYKSAGIMLNWHNQHTLQSETQKLMKAWRCDHCGAIGHSLGTQFQEKCIQCDETLNLKHSLDFIEPSGFAVDFYESPTTDVSTQVYIPVQEPWITANESIVSLPNPDMGHYCIGTQGDIFYHSSGQNGQGYAICLFCGKAESIGSNKTILQNHKVLRGKQSSEQDSRCAGNDHEFSIKSNLHLGFVDHTDVLELYLKSATEGLFLNHELKDSKKIAWTLAVVLRQSLADILGINADELGYTVKPTVLAECDYPIATIVIYDDCSGGAGFSSTADRYFDEIFKKVKTEYLQCSCKKVCQNCLLGFDTRFHVDYLDRQLALDFLNAV